MATARRAKRRGGRGARRVDWRRPQAKRLLKEEVRRSRFEGLGMTENEHQDVILPDA